MREQGERHEPLKVSRSQEVEDMLAHAYIDIEMLTQAEICSPEEVEKMIRYLATLDSGSSLRPHQRVVEALTAFTERATRESFDVTPYAAAAQASSNIIISDRIPSGGVAEYHPYTGRYSVNSKHKEEVFPSPEALLYSFATKGESEGLLVLHHEFIHSQQFDPPKEERKNVKVKF